MEALPQTQEYVARKELYAKGQTGASGTEAVVRLAIDVFPWMLFRSWKPPVHVDVLPLGTAAAGSLVVALAIFAIWRVRAAESWFFTGLLVLGLISGTNWQPVSNAWKKLPLFDVSFNDYLAYAAAFSFVVLAALALEHAWRQSEWRLLAVNVALVSLILTAATMVIQRAGIIAPNFEQYGDFRLFAEVAAPALAALLLLSRLPARYTVAALVLLVLAQRTIEEGGVYPVIPAEAAYPPIPILAALPHIREPFRIVGQGLSFIPGTSSVYGLEDVRGYTAMTFAPQVVTWPLWCRGQPVWFNAVDDLERPFLSFLNVRYAITWTHEGDHPGWREVARQRGTKLLENTRVIERAFIPDELTLGSGAPIFEMKKAADFRKRAWIWTDGPEVDQQNGSGTIDLERQNLGFRLSVVMKRAGWIVVSEQAWRGWRAYIDGRRVKIHTANIAFLGIYVPEGKHVVDVRYWPESFVIGRAISFGSIAVVIAIAVAARITRRRRTTVATQS